MSNQQGDISAVSFLANLARVALTPEEQQRLDGEFREVVAFVGRLAGRAGQAPPLTGTISGVQNVLREDVVTPSGQEDALVRQAPDVQDHAVRVPPVR